MLVAHSVVGVARKESVHPLLPFAGLLVKIILHYGHPLVASRLQSGDENRILLFELKLAQVSLARKFAVFGRLTTSSALKFLLMAPS